MQWVSKGKKKKQEENRKKDSEKVGIKNIQRTKPQFNLKLLYICIFPAVYIIIDLFLNEKMFESNWDFVTQIQSDYWQNENYRNAMYFLTIYGYGVVIFMIMILEYLIKKQQ